MEDAGIDEFSILHVDVDMDAFFAAMVIRANPSHRGRLVIVVRGNPRARGAVSSASYKAREYGVKSAMPLQGTYRRYPQGIY